MQTTDPPQVLLTPEALSPPVAGSAGSVVVEARALVWATPTTRSVLEAPLAEVSLSAACLDLTLVMMAAIVTRYFPTLLHYALSPEPPQMDEVGWFAVAAKWSEMALGLTLLAYLALRAGVPAADLGLRARGIPRQAGWGALSLAAAYAYLAVSTLALVGVLRFAPQFQTDLNRRLEFTSAMPADDLLLSTLLLVPVAVHEEVIFRGLLLPYLWRISGSALIATLLSALIFGVLHINQGLLAMVQIIGLGAVFGTFFVFSRSLLAVCLAHFAFNFLQFQLIRMLPLRQLLEQAQRGG